MTKSYVEYHISSMTYEERSRLVIKIAKMRKLRVNGSRVYIWSGWDHWTSEETDVSDLNLHYDPNIMKLEDIGYMLQKNNRRQIWT